MRITHILLALVAGTGGAVAHAAPPEGHLCCNMRTDGSWISDSNYAENGKRIIPYGTPVKATGYGRYRVKVLVDGKRQEIGNDYSRDLENEEFARRYIVAEDPRAKAAGYPAKIREAIESARVTRGMTREQVLMALVYKGLDSAKKDPTSVLDLYGCVKDNVTTNINAAMMVYLARQAIKLDFDGQIHNVPGHSELGEQNHAVYVVDEEAFLAMIMDIFYDPVE